MHIENLFILEMEVDNNKLDIELTNETAQGSYANLAIITHSSNEFILDFINFLPGMPKARVTDRIIMTPENAKRLFQALRDNMDKFENQFGTIRLNNEPISNIPMGFGSPNAKA